jgi:Rrf2 family protein
MHLQLTRRSDYAVRALSLLAARPDSVVSSSRIREQTAIPARFVVPVMSDLVRAGLVEAHLGRAGGYRLAANAADVSILTIVEAVEGVRRRTECALTQRPCGAVPCRLHNILARADEAYLAELAAVSLASVQERPDGGGQRD